MTLAEQETIYRWDMEERLIWGYTTHLPTMRQWEAKGYTVSGDGPRGWRMTAPVGSLTLRSKNRAKRQLSQEHLAKLKAGRDAKTMPEKV